MKRFLALLALLGTFSCAQAQKKVTQLNPEQFHAVIANDINAQIIDVRTPEEFQNGHIPRAKNLQIQKDQAELYQQLDKTKPVYLYCLAGGRSAAAAEKLVAKGYTVFELEKGINSWRAAKMPEVKDQNNATASMSMEEYEKEISSFSLVFVDFYAKWCGPCVKMNPEIEELKKELEGKVKIVKIDIDANSALAIKLNALSLPTLKIYKDGKQTWEHIGYLSKEDIKAALSK